MYINLEANDQTGRTSEMLYCHGCGREFAPRGYSQHIRLTHNQACLAAHREQEISAEIDAGLEVNDYFGVYRVEDLRWPSMGDGEVLDEANHQQNEEEDDSKGKEEVEADNQQNEEEDDDSEDNVDEGILSSFHSGVLVLINHSLQTLLLKVDLPQMKNPVVQRPIT